MVSTGVELVLPLVCSPLMQTQLELAGDVAQRRMLVEVYGSWVSHHLDLLRGGRPAEDPFLRPDTDHMGR